MFPKIQKRLVALAISGLSYFALCVWVSIDRTPKLAEADVLAAEKIRAAKQQEMSVIYAREAAKDAAIRRAEDAQKEAEEQAMQKRVMENGRRGCLDDRNDAYLQLPLKVITRFFDPVLLVFLEEQPYP